MSLYTDAFAATESDFYIAANEHDKNTLNKFLTTDWFPFTTADAYVRNLPPYILRDVERAIKNVEHVNRRMTKDLDTPIVKVYNGRSSVSHRTARS